MDPSLYLLGFAVGYAIGALGLAWLNERGRL